MIPMVWSDEESVDEQPSPKAASSSTLEATRAKVILRERDVSKTIPHERDHTPAMPRICYPTVMQAQEIANRNGVSLALVARPFSHQ